jgi:hypothetical protein
MKQKDSLGDMEDIDNGMLEGIESSSLSEHT